MNLPEAKLANGIRITYSIDMMAAVRGGRSHFLLWGFTNITVLYTKTKGGMGAAVYHPRAPVRKTRTLPCETGPFMKSKIKALESKARQLEPVAGSRKQFTGPVLQYLEEFLQDLPEKKAYAEPRHKLSSIPFSEKPADIDELLGYLRTNVDSNGLNPASGGHLGYIPGGGLYPSALGDLIAAVTNRYAGVFFSSPGAVHVENQCIRWLCDLIGYGPGAGGNLTSGGSLANLIALVNARDDAGLHSSDFEQTVIYTTRQVHHCVNKAVNFAGLGDAHLRNIPMDGHFRMQPAELNRQIEEDRRAGLRPLIIFASAGTTDVGAVDPLAPIGDIAKDHDTWFHVDAAYGGAFLLTDHGKEKMQGLEKAHSVTIDPHKGLFLPYGSGALLVKNAARLRASQHMTANYMQDTLAADEEYSPADLSPELSKHFRGLRMWLPLNLFGVAPFRAALQEKLLLTRYFYEAIQQIDGIEVGPEPELSVLLFRYVPDHGDADRFNRALLDAIHRDGRLFLSSTSIEGTFYLRLAVLHFRTHLETIEEALALLKKLIGSLKST